MAEGWARHLKSDKIEAYSAGTKPQGLNPTAVKVSCSPQTPATFLIRHHLFDNHAQTGLAAEHRHSAPSGRRPRIRAGSIYEFFVNTVVPRTRACLIILSWRLTSHVLVVCACLFLLCVSSALFVYLLITACPFFARICSHCLSHNLLHPFPLSSTLAASLHVFSPCSLWLLMVMWSAQRVFTIALFTMLLICALLCSISFIASLSLSFVFVFLLRHGLSLFSFLSALRLWQRLVSTFQNTLQSTQIH